MAVDADGAPQADDTGGLAALRERNVDLPAASPWLPRRRWQLGLIGGLFWLGISAAAVLLIQPVPPHPQLAPAINHLVGGPRPVLAVYSDILLWAMAAQLATLVGWYRSHSQLDFQGRYRRWAWAAIVFAAWSFCAGTGIHTAIGVVAGPMLRWPIWRAETVVWLAPAMAAGLSVWWVIDGDLRRWRVSRNLVQLSLCLLLMTGAARLYQPEMAGHAWYAGAIVAGQFLGMGLLLTGLWLHAWYVTYVSADPPEPCEPFDWRGTAFAIVATLVRWLLWPFRRRGTTDAKTSRKKGESDEVAAPKRRRKTAAKKRTTRSRTRVKTEGDEETTDDGESAAGDDSESDEDWTDEEEETPPASAKPQASMPPRPTPASNIRQPGSQSSWSSNDDDSSESDDEDDSQYRVDATHDGVDPFKGLSKRQRRELKRQMREQQRQQQHGR